MRVLGLDVSSSCTGWAIIENGELKEHSAFEQSDKEFNKRSPSHKLRSFGDMLYGLLECELPDFIAIEDVPHVRSVHVTKLLSRYAGVTYQMCWNHNKLEPDIYVAGHWRKVCGLKGNGSKEETQQWCLEKFGVDVNNDVADSIGIAWCCYLEHSA